MKKRTKRLSFFFTAVLAVMMLAEAASASASYRVGVLARREKDTCMLEWQETARYLSGKIKGCSFKIVPLDFNEIKKAVEQKEVDFLICNPAMYVDLATYCDAQRIATLKRWDAGKTFGDFSAVIFTRADTAGIRSLTDIRKKSFMAVDKNSFGGWLMALREFKEVGINPSIDFKRIEFAGSHDAVVYAVRDGRVDAGTVSSGILESMEREGKISLREFKILNRNMYPDISFPYEHSTRLYPEWPFLKLEHTPDAVTEKVTVALLEMPPDSPAAQAAGCAGWTYTVSYKSVYACLEKVKYGPYKDWGEIRLYEFLKQYGKYITTVFAGTALLFLFTMYILVLNRRLQRSNSSIRKEVEGHTTTMALLQESRQRAEQVLKIVPSAVMTADTQRRMTSWNDQAEALTGYTAQEAIGNDCFLFVEQPCKTQCRVFDDAYAKPIIGRECTIRRKDGQIRTIEKNADIIRDERGAVIGAVESFKDITARITAEQELRREKELAQQYLYIAGVIMIIVDADQLLRLINKKGCEVLGWSADELIGKNWFDTCLPPAWARRGRRLFAEILAGNVELKESFEAPVVTKAGTQRLIAWHMTVIRGDEGRIVSMLSSGEDITERHQAQVGLRESELKFRALSDSATDAILMMDSQGTITLWNSAAENIFGWTPEEALGMDLHELLAPRRYHEQYEKAMPLFREIGQGNAIGKTMELVSNTRCGAEIPVELSLSSISLKGAFYAVGILRDISRRKETEQALREAMHAAEAANAAKSQFVANMSHEIRTPMNGVIGMTGLLLGTGLSAEQRGYAEAVRSSADSLLSIINDILDFSKIEAGKMELEILDFDLRIMLEEMADMLAFKAQERGLEYVWVAQPDVPSLVNGDPGRLRQVLVNLVDNAVKFTQMGSVSVVASLEHEDSAAACIRFEVTDTGIGVPAEKIDMLFQPFVQADSSTTRKYGGTGLGLSICRQLVALMGGAIGVRSKPGEGSTFWFTAALRKQADQAPAASLPMADIRGQRIIVVDDNAINRQLVKAYLQSWNCRVHEAADAHTALEQMYIAVAAGDPFSIAILDMQMPGMDGEQLGAAIKQAPALRECALVMMTSVGRRGDVWRLKGIGFAGYLPKPVKQSYLYGCLAAVLGLQKSPDFSPQDQIVTRHILDESRRSKIRILIAEDNVTSQKVAAGILQKLGYRADMVANGLEAVRQLERIAYDLVLMDIQMPEMDGFAATRAIRALKNGKHIPIIAMTAGAMQQDRDDCIAAGMDDYIAKPVTPQTIAGKLAQWLKGARQHASAETVQVMAGETACLVFDRPALIKRLMGDTDLADSIVAGFVEHLSQYIAVIRAAHAQADTAALRRSGHTLKGSAANVGANALSAIALQIEKAGETGNFAAIPDLIESLEEQAALFMKIVSAQTTVGDTV